MSIDDFWKYCDDIAKRKETRSKKPGKPKCWAARTEWRRDEKPRPDPGPEKYLFEIRHSPDGKNWEKVGKGTFYFQASALAKHLSIALHGYVRVFNVELGVPLVCYRDGMTWSVERDGFPTQ